MRGMFKIVGIGIAILLLWMMLSGGEEGEKTTKKEEPSKLNTPATTYIRPGIVLEKLVKEGFHVSSDPSFSFAGKNSGISNYPKNKIQAAKEGALSCVVAYTAAEGETLYAQLKADPEKGLFKRRVANVVCLYSTSDGGGKLLPDKSKNLDKALQSMANSVS